jgi:hypothetical protein
MVKFVFRYIFGLFSLFSHRIVVHEAFQQDQLIHEHSISIEKIHTVPHGVPENPIVHTDGYVHFSIPTDKKIFLYMGFAARYK